MRLILFILLIFSSLIRCSTMNKKTIDETLLGRNIKEISLTYVDMEFLKVHNSRGNYTFINIPPVGVIFYLDSNKNIINIKMVFDSSMEKELTNRIQNIYGNPLIMSNKNPDINKKEGDFSLFTINTYKTMEKNNSVKEDNILGYKWKKLETYIDLIRPRMKENHFEVLMTKVK